MKLNLDFTKYIGKTLLKDWWPVVLDHIRQIQNAVNTNDTALTTEASERKSADTALGGRITTETSERKSADTALGGRIDTETAARESADTALGGRIDSEAQSRTSADTALGGRIDAEASERKAVDATLGQRIDTEISIREAAVSGEAKTRADADAALRTDITALQENSHTHGNKSVLDNLTQSVIANSHSHTNKRLLDGITAADIERWDESGEIPMWYRMEVDRRINEILVGLGVGAYDGGYFGDTTEGKSINGGSFSDSVVGRTVDCGGFEPLTFDIGGAGLSDRVGAIEETLAAAEVANVTIANEAAIDAIFDE